MRFLVASFKGVRRYGDNVVGVHLGQAFTMVWLALTSLGMRRSPLFPRWVSWLGFVAAFAYLLGQSEVFALVFDNFPIVPESGLIGAYLWVAWMLAVAVFLLRAKPEQITI